MSSFLKSTGHLSLILVLTSLCNVSVADTFFDKVYIDGRYGLGAYDPRGHNIDVEAFSLGAGFKINEQFVAAGQASSVDFDGIESLLLSGQVIYQHPFKDKMTFFAKGGIDYWDSSDIDESEAGIVLGGGIKWGLGKMQFTAGYDYHAGLENNAAFDDIHIFSIGLQYHFGNRIVKDSTRGVGNSITACEQKHGHLFFACDKEKQ
ncbi:MAG: porin family protein [Pseudomonadales bacterium]|nr:porin family protein [Pseudomonadales bacterium]